MTSLRTLSSFRGLANALAGPSRISISPLRFRPRRLLQCRSASSAIPRKLTPFSVPPQSTLQPRSTAWQFRPIPSPPGTTEAERLIYARPYEGPLGNRVRMLIFLVPFWGLISGIYFTTPSPPKKDGEYPTPTSVLWSYANMGAMFGTTLMCGLWLFSPSRFITRLAQVRRVADGKEKEFIRLQHGGHLMGVGSMAKFRDVPKGDVSVKLIGKHIARSPYLSLHIENKKRFTLDSFNYRLDFRDTPAVKQSEEEVVLSLSRIETVFGKLS